MSAVRFRPEPPLELLILQGSGGFEAFFSLSEKLPVKGPLHDLGGVIPHLTFLAAREGCAPP